MIGNTVLKVGATLIQAVGLIRGMSTRSLLIIHSLILPQVRRVPTCAVVVAVFRTGTQLQTLPLAEGARRHLRSPATFQQRPDVRRHYGDLHANSRIRSTSESCPGYLVEFGEANENLMVVLRRATV